MKTRFPMRHNLNLLIQKPIYQDQPLAAEPVFSVPLDLVIVSANILLLAYMIYLSPLSLMHSNLNQKIITSKKLLKCDSQFRNIISLCLRKKW